MESRPQEQITVDDGLVHVYPLFGREHVLEGLGCWCHPILDNGVVIHEQEH